VLVERRLFFALGIFRDGKKKSYNKRKIGMVKKSSEIEKVVIKKENCEKNRGKVGKKVKL
jgi:hypothetical protein